MDGGCGCDALGNLQDVQGEAHDDVGSPWNYASRTWGALIDASRRGLARSRCARNRWVAESDTAELSNGGREGVFAGRGGEDAPLGLSFPAPAQCA